MQLFVRGLQACTRACEVEPCGSVADLKLRIQEVEGVPSCWQGLVWRGRQLQDDRSLHSYGIEPHSTLHLVLRLRGGKGGFGALLRGLGRDGSKTTNDDAMRDLQGRRMRHSNAEAKLKEWEAKAKERELEKIALQHIKQQERLARREAENKVEVESVVAAQKAAITGVQDAVQSALAEAKKATAGGSGSGAGAGPAVPGKRAAAAVAGPAGAAAACAGGKGPGPAAKRSRMMAALETFGSDDEGGGSESSTDDEEGA
ncbi:hypothetical protein GPECTOR_1g242 [Gonium pectorale]|uniref:Ubiquitin-like domain-containing protein n=1 Tax=Gonium pectorale TaxID=33097 RepID=A0A150H298_GONPE|nr:hypothetical protein GPECTOR_1g242 [Gonium pectorale]|eukprot:KXZ56277.1 hypothetical protein GPECTOR_1g242 [Gonium pectorale]